MNGLKSEITEELGSVAKADRRRDWALVILAGGGMTMTLYSIAVLYMSQSEVKYVFYLGVLAMLQIFVVFTGLLGLLVKRNLTISRAGITVSDFDPDKDDLIPRGDAIEAVEEAVHEVPKVDGSTDKQS